MTQNARFASLRAEGLLAADSLDVTTNLSAAQLSLPAVVGGGASPLGLTVLETGLQPRDAQVPSKRAVDVVGAGLVPIGTVVMWFGAASAVPDGWEIYAPAAGAFVMGSDENNAPGTSRGADGTESAAVHTTSVPLPSHTHTVNETTASGSTTTYTHQHRFRESTIGNMKSGVLETPGTMQSGRASLTTGQQILYYIGRDQQLMSGGVVPYTSTPFGFLAPSPQSFWGITGAVMQDKLTHRGHNNTGGATGIYAGSTGRHAHTVNMRHTHPTEETGTAAPTLNIEPPYRTLHYIRKVREPAFSD
jgi:hypothetical protein